MQKPAVADKLESTRFYINPIEWLAQRGLPTDNLTFDENIVPQYRIRRGSTHDGTLLFSLELIQDVLFRLLERRSYYTPMGPPGPTVRDVRYTVGLIRVAIVVGIVDLPCGHYPGQRERLCLPVRCEYVSEAVA